MPDLNTAFAEAVAKHQSGDVVAAERLYRSLLAQFPTHTPSLCNLGVLLVKTGRADEAREQYNLALAATPDYPDAHYNLGNLYRRSQQLVEAERHFRACLEGNPNHASALYNHGLTMAAMGDLDAAIHAFNRVVKLEPKNADAYSRLGDACVRTGRLTEGVTAFRKAAELAPNDPRMHYNLGLALSNTGHPAEAHESLQRALRLRPDYAEAHNAVGLNLETQNRKDDALFHYQEAVRLKPDLADGWSNLGTNLAEQGRTEDAINCLRESLAQKPNSPPIHSNLLLLLNYTSDLDPESIRDEHQAWAERFTLPNPDPARIPPPHDLQRRLRIGYLSGDFRKHTVAPFIGTLLKHHDRTQVECFAYANVLRTDEVTQELQQLADVWRPIGGMAEERVYDLIHADQLDILIDLSGHTAGNRMLVLSARPAPIQATLFGYPNTTGMEAVDFRISDSWSDPPGVTDHLYTETVLRLPDVPWVYVPPEDAPEPGPLPAATRRTFTFGCLNNPAKISEACLAMWVKLLQSTPGTRLVLLAGQSQQGSKRLMDRFMTAGILRDRIELVMRLPKEQYFESYQLFDATLDPMPYNGGVTTCDSLWMGVPVFCITGKSYVSRQGAMLMHTLGLSEFVADSPDSLIALAKSWVKRREELAEIRAGLRERMRASPIIDGERYVRNLEAVLRQEWIKRLPHE